MNIFYIDGAFVPEDEALVSAKDLSVIRGYGIFDFLRTYNGKPLTLRKNIARLHRSAEIIGLDCPYSEDEIYEAVMQTLAKNGHDESNIRIVVTGGVSSDFITPDSHPKLLVMVTELKSLPSEWYEQGVKVTLFETERFPASAKSINYIAAIMALKKAREAGAIEAIYTDKHNFVLEGTTTNIFGFSNGRLFTPRNDILPGITRDMILEVVQGVFPVEIRDVTVEEVLAADEVFITAANKRIVPVVEIDDSVIGHGKPGIHTRRVMALFDAVTIHAAEKV